MDTLIQKNSFLDQENKQFSGWPVSAEKASLVLPVILITNQIKYYLGQYNRINIISYTINKNKKAARTRTWPRSTFHGFREGYSAASFNNKLNIIWGALIRSILCHVNKNKNKKTSRTSTSVAVLAEMSLRSPRKLVIFIIKKYIYRIEVSKNKFI